MTDPAEDEWREREAKHEALSLADGKCPWSGLVLHRGGEAGPDTASCDVCDCFGFDPATVKVWPKPLNVARWKVVRRVCGKCGGQFTAPNCDVSTICSFCLGEALGLLPVVQASPFDAPAYFDADDGPVRAVRFTPVSEDEALDF